MEEIEYLSEREKGRGRKKENAVCVYVCVSTCVSVCVSVSVCV